MLPFIWSTILAVCLCFTGYAQHTSPYDVHWGSEAAILATTGALYGTGQYLRTEVEPLPASFDYDFDVHDIWVLDRSAALQWCERSDAWSDHTFHAAAAMPLLLFADKRVRKDAWKIGLMFGETMMLSDGITNVFKGTTSRKRPYLYNPDAPEYLRYKKQATMSFLSGHTSSTAMLSFFAAKVYADYHPDSPYQYVGYGSAFALTAATGYLRYRAGKHYPTDIIAGFAVGALSGWLIPELHRADRALWLRRLQVRSSSLDTGERTVGLVYTF